MREFNPMGLLDAVAAQLAAFEALLLIASALHKGATWSRARTAVQRFAGVPTSMASAVLGSVIAGEVVAGALLIVPVTRMAGGITASLIWAMYLGLIVRAISQGRSDVDCGCSFGSAQRPLGAFQTARNAVLMALALFIAVVSGGIGDAFSGGSAAVAAGGAILSFQLLAALGLLALYGALDQVMAVQPLRGGELL
jgi:Methylamine utilisation protein MauE